VGFLLMFRFFFVNLSQQLAWQPFSSTFPGLFWAHYSLVALSSGKRA
jgi:hypothetical protein